MNLREYCRKKEISLPKMAKKLGISTSYINNIVYNRKKPSQKLAKKIYEITNNEVTEADLFPIFKCPHCGKEIAEH